MNGRKRIGLIEICLVLLIATAAFGKDAGSNTLCSHQFALCTAAACVPAPGETSKAICFCDVEEGKSMSSMPCDKVAPKADANGIRTIFSAFSLRQFESGKQGMKCPAGTPWTWCLNKPCTVSQIDSKKALCMCDVRRTGEWMTLGGDCDTSTCTMGYWSAAPLADFAGGEAFLIKSLPLEKSPVTWCPATP